LDFVTSQSLSTCSSQNCSGFDFLVKLSCCLNHFSRFISTR
jgi:hypothetical protein